MGACCLLDIVTRAGEPVDVAAHSHRRHAVQIGVVAKISLYVRDGDSVLLVAFAGKAVEHMDYSLVIQSIPSFLYGWAPSVMNKLYHSPQMLSNGIENVRCENSRIDVPLFAENVYLSETFL